MKRYFLLKLVHVQIMYRQKSRGPVKDTEALLGEPRADRVAGQGY